jgi:hypothetical protein
VAVGFEEAAVVEPVDPFEGGVLEVVEAAPRATVADHRRAETILVHVQSAGEVSRERRSMKISLREPWFRKSPAQLLVLPHLAASPGITRLRELPAGVM